MGLEVAQLLLPQPVSKTAEAEFNRMLELRCHHMPADKIIGRRGFYKYEFVVDSNVLSPRPDTEILLEKALEYARRDNYKKVLELGVGSGCVVCSLLAELPQLRAVGIDISASALKVAHANAQRLNVAAALELRQADWFDADFMALAGSGYDMVVSNPPYIAASEIAGLDSEVKDYDPRPALDGGADGLASYRQIAAWMPQLLQDGGIAVLEVGEGQAAAVAEIFSEQGLRRLETAVDLNGVERCISLKK